MGTKQIRVSEDLYARIESEKNPDETLERLVGGYSLTEFADDATELDLDFSVEEVTDGAVDAPRRTNDSRCAVSGRTGRR